ncbi:hypothetical protein P691DRAFT_298045 [Macrolepiota fuliginosa MF-IS2]|uniref:Uncharacterized protein n=1 Tax=Macrolepiota fuliginosa MF-IS2 TaxID=1400762 RepID=A0A9P5X8B8_9AGAR|nr:hypothetical protein P691DRAFT_298045 [Macrolepiota fuliginosa MF-IS2]
MQSITNIYLFYFCTNPSISTPPIWDLTICTVASWQRTFGHSFMRRLESLDPGLHFSLPLSPGSERRNSRNRGSVGSFAIHASDDRPYILHHTTDHPLMYWSIFSSIGLPLVSDERTRRRERKRRKAENDMDEQDEKHARRYHLQPEYQCHGLISTQYRLPPSRASPSYHFAFTNDTKLPSFGRPL